MKKYNEYIGGVHPKTYNLLFEDIKQLNFDDENDIKFIIKEHIRFYTYSIFTKIGNLYDFILKQLYESKIYKNKDYENMYDCKLLDNVYTFGIISNIIAHKFAKKELKSKKRIGQCHNRSVDFLLCNVENGNVVTGYHKGLSHKFLHSIVEVDINIDFEQITYVFDYTFNIYMRKTEYYKLFNFEEIHRINTKEFLDDFEILDNFLDINLKALLIFNREILSAMKVDKDFFNNKQDKKQQILNCREFYK